MIHIGFSKGQSVDIRLLHTIVAAQTRYGKSTTIRTMMQDIPDNYQVLCLDVKDPRDFEGAGTEIPIYIENKTDPLMLKQLLEQESHLWLRKEFPELIDLCKEGDPFEKVYERVCKRMEEKVHPVVRDRLKVLRLLLKSLVENMAKIELSDTLKLPAKNNVMNVSKAPSAIKQLAVYSAVKWVLEKLENVVLVIDELPDFAPQQYTTPSKNMITHAIRKGGAKGIWLWLSGQTMTGVEKQVLKQAMIWILGHQREINEAKRTLEQIPFKTGLDVKDIMTLPVGSFVVCTDEGAYITYVQPEGVDDGIARAVSLGEESVNDVIEMLKKGKENEDLVYKELYEKVKKERDDMVEKLEELEKSVDKRLEDVRQAAFKEALEKVEQIKKEWKIDEYQETIVKLKDEKEQLKQENEELHKKERAIDKFTDSLAELFEAVGVKVTTLTTGTPSAMPTMPGITVAEVDERIRQIISSGPKPIPVVSVDVDQRIKELVKNEVVNRIVGKIKSLPDPAKKAAWWLHEKKQTNIRALYNYIFDKPPEETGRIPGTFYMNVVNPLQDAWLIVNENGNLRWILKEKLAAELKDVLSGSDLEKVPKYLASLLL